MKYRRAMSMGDVRHEVNRSAGSSGQEGRDSWDMHAASCKDDMKGVYS